MDRSKRKFEDYLKNGEDIEATTVTNSCHADIIDQFMSWWYYRIVPVLAGGMIIFFLLILTVIFTLPALPPWVMTLIMASLPILSVLIAELLFRLKQSYFNPGKRLRKY